MSFSSRVSDALVRVGTEIKAVRAVANAKYTKPASGIPSTDMTSAVQASLAKADASSSVAPVTRSAAYCFEMCQQPFNNNANTGFHLRRPFRLGVKPNRFRVRIQNRIQLSGSSPTGEAGNIYNLNVVIGKPGVDANGDMNGTWASTPLEIFPAANMPAGTEAVSGWIDASAYALNVDELNLLGYSFVSGNVANSQVALSGGFSWRDSTPANLKVLAPSTALVKSDNAAFLQVIIEYEHTDKDARQLLVVGNSLSGPSSNSGATPFPITSVGEMGTWHQIWAQNNRCIASSIAVAGSYSSHFLPGGTQWDVFDGFNIPYVPDMIIFFAASSSDIADCTNVTTSNNVKTYIRNVTKRARAKHPNTWRIYWTNVPPRSNFTGAATSSTTNEYWRRELNAWFHSNLPTTINGCIDIDSILTNWAATTTACALRDVYTTEGVHLTVRAHQDCSEKIPLGRAA